MKLRGHHLFCTALFSGCGYDEAFTENMKSVLEKLQAGEKVQLAEGPDRVCSACPNSQPDGGCSLGTDDVARRDREALRLMQAVPGDKFAWREAGEKLSRLTEDQFRAVCGNCRWQKEGLCSYRLLMERAACILSRTVLKS